MMVGVDSSDSLIETIKGQRLLASLFGLTFGAMLIGAITSSLASPSVGLAAANANSRGHIQALASLIFRDYVFAFEALSALLITAAVGSIILAHNERWAPRKTQDQMQRERTLGTHVTPLPAPGVLASTNAVDTPALLPDGSISTTSLPGSFGIKGQVDTARGITEEGK
jgi:NADH-quinone oxidoreductase subunit J